jgi:phytoene dehydrogenase-like protein
MNAPQTVVIGGGMAGMAAAAYLARSGVTVTVLEKAASPGGRAATDTPNGFALNRGGHALYSGAAATSVLAELGVTYTSGRPRGYLARDARGLHVFPATARNIMRTRLLDAADKAELILAFTRLATTPPSSVAHLSTAQWIERTMRRPKLRSFMTAFARVSLYTTALELASADTFLDHAQQALQHPVQYVDGGWQSLVDGLRQAAESAGADVLICSGVSEIVLRDGRADSVRLHDGRELKANSVIVATPPEDVLRLLPESAAPRLHETLSRLVPVHVACLDLALTHLPVPLQPIIFDLEQPRFMTAQSEFARLAPNGGAVVHLLRFLHPRDAGDASHERAELETLLDEVQPGWREVVVEQRFLPRMLALGALPLAGASGLAGRPAHQCAEIANVYFAGDWVGPEGYLADAALASARTAARLAVTAPQRPVLAAA